MVEKNIKGIGRFWQIIEGRSYLFRQKMKLTSKVLLIIISVMHALIVKAYGDDRVFDWMNADIMSFTPSPRCIEVPTFSSVNQSRKNLNVENPGVWVPAGVHVDQGKMLSMMWLYFSGQLIRDNINRKEVENDKNKTKDLSG